MNMIKQIIKIILPNKFYYQLYNFYLILRHPKKELPNYILKKKYFVKDDKKNNLFSLRLMGGAILGRGTSFYTKEPETVNWIKNFDKESVFFDIGANVGIYSLFAAKLNHRTVSFEPESHNFAALNININDNNFEKKIISYPISLDEKMIISQLNIFKFRFGGSGHSFDRSINSKGKEFTTSHTQGSISLTLDKFSEETKICPNYIKIDVDGNELRVVNGMKNLLASKKIKSILIELDRTFSEHIEVVNILKSFDYNLSFYKDKNGCSNHIFNLN